MAVVAIDAKTNLPSLQNGPVTIAEISLGKDTLRIELTTFNDRPFLSAWRFYTHSSGELRPGRHGLACSLEHLPAIADAFARAVERASADGLLPPPDAKQDQGKRRK